jgi:hypothetical protein
MTFVSRSRNIVVSPEPNISRRPLARKEVPQSSQSARRAEEKLTQIRQDNHSWEISAAPDSIFLLAVASLMMIRPCCSNVEINADDHQEIQFCYSMVERFQIRGLTYTGFELTVLVLFGAWMDGGGWALTVRDVDNKNMIYCVLFWELGPKTAFFRS